MQPKLRLLGMTMGVILMTLFSTVANAQYKTNVGNATVTTDKPDYAPRSNAVFTGKGFLPGDSVRLKVRNLSRACNTYDHTDSSYQVWTVLADANGGFVTNWTVCDCAGDSLRLRAVGVSSHDTAYAYFSDGGITITTDTKWSELDDPDIAGIQPPSSNDAIIVKNGATLTIDVNNAICGSIQLGQSSNPGGAGTLVFNNDTKLTVTSLTIGQNGQNPGFLDMTSGGTLQIAGTSVVNALGSPNGFKPGSGTIEYNGTSPQSVLDVDYYNLTISNIGTKTWTPFNFLSRIVNGTITIGNGSTFAIGGAWTLQVKGDWSNNGGTFNPGSGTVRFNNITADQSINGTATTQTFNNLDVIKGPTKLMIGGSTNKVTVRSTLSMSSGNIDAGTNTLELGNSTVSVGTLSYAAGSILGNFKRWINTTNPGILFPVGTATNNRNALVTFSNLTNGSLTARFVASDPGNAGLSLTENSISIDNQFTEGYWSLVKGDGLASTNYALELTGNGFTSYTIDANTRIIKRPDAVANWTLDGVHVSATGTTAKRSGLNNFSQFALATASSCSNPIINTQPEAPAAVCSGNGTRTISVGATGPGTITYQWRRNGVALTNTGVYSGVTTSTLTITNPTTSDAGSFDVVLTRACGSSATSNSVNLTVNAPPTNSSAGNDQTICPSSIATLTANNPSVGTGAWLVVSGPNTASTQFTSTTDPGTTFTPAGGNGTYILRWTISNAPCAASSDEVSITVADDDKPTFTSTLSGNVDKGTNDACTYKVAGTEFDATATDNCAVTSLTYSLSGQTVVADAAGNTSLAGVALNKGVTTITWTAKDAAGNTETQVFTVTVADDDKPTFTSTLSGNVDKGTNDACTYKVAGTEFDATATDNCAVTSLTYSLSGQTVVADAAGNTSLAGVALNKGVTTITWTAKDAAGNTETQVFTVTVADDDKPTFTSTLSGNVDKGTNDACTYKVAGTEFDATATDNCAVTSLTYSLSGQTVVADAAGNTSLAGVALNKGVTTITWTAKDAAGNTETQVFTVTVADDDKPTFTSTLSGNVDKGTNDACTYKVAGTEFDATATDNCAVTSLTYSLSGQTVVADAAGNTSLAGVALNKGVTTITWTAKDAAGNTETQVFTVTVADDDKPTFTSTLSGNVDKGTNDACTYKVAGTEFDATATDNCAVTSLTYSLSGQTVVADAAGNTSLAGVALNKGVTTITWTAKDAAGNTETQVFTVTVADDDKPTFTSTLSGNVDKGTNDACTYKVAGTEFDATATDNCAVTSLTYSLSGQTVVADAAGNTSLAGVALNKGVTTITWTAKDAAGNTETQVFTVTVADDDKPTFTSTLSGNVDKGTNDACTYKVAGTEFDATATDNCAVTSLTYSLSGQTVVADAAGNTSLAGVALNKGVTTITWTAKDAAGNTETQVFTVTVADDDKPTFTSTLSGNVDKGTNDACTYKVAGTEFDATATDNCAVTSLTYSLSGQTVVADAAGNTSLAGVALNKGVTTITWTAKDAAGNTETQVFTVTVADDDKPTFTSTLSGNVDKGTNDACTYKVAGTEFDATATDNCAVTSLTYSLSGQTVVADAAGNTSLAGVALNKGVTTITWTAKDAAGNTETQVFTVTVADDDKPTFTSTLSGNVDKGTNDACTYKVAGTEFDATATDNCAVTSLTYSLSGQTVVADAAGNTSLAGVALNKGVTTITWTAKDAAGNTETQVFTVTVADDDKPTFTSTLSGNVDKGTNDACTYKVAGTEFDATATDNCAVTSLTYSLSGQTVVADAAGNTSLAGVALNKGVTTITWTAKDAAGNTETQVFTVTVADDDKPTFTSTLSGNVDKGTNDACTYKVAGTEFDATATDNCAVTSLTYSLSGQTVVADAAGNTSLAGVALNKGVTTITWTAKDAAGNTETQVFTVTVADDDKPTFTSTLSGNVDKGTNDACTYKVAGTEFDATATDNCAVTSLTYSLSGQTVVADAAGNTSLAGVALNKGVTTITWTAKDAAGNTETQVFTVTVADDDKPTFTSTLSGNVDKGTNDACTYKVAGTEFDATATDNCAVTSLTYSLSGQTVVADAAGNTSLAGVALNKGVTTITWTAKDAAGNTETQVFTVTVADDDKPTFTSTLSGNVDKGTNDACTYKVAGTEFDATATDNCAVTSLTYSLSGQTVVADAAGNTSLAGVALNKGVTTITWTAKDAAGNTETQVFTVTVADDDKPTFTSTLSGNVDKGTNDACTYKVAGTEFDATATDNCAVTSLTYSLSGQTVVADAAGNTSLAGVALNKGVTTITWTAKDAAGNTETQVFTVTVADDDKPTFTSTLSGNVDKGTNDACTYKVAGTEFDATATDNCAVTSLTYSLSGQTVVADAAGNTSLAGVALNKGVTTITWTAKDAAGNTETQVFTVTVADDDKPTFTSTLSGNVDKGTNDACTYKVAGTEFDATATDNCAVTSLTYSLSGQTVVADAAGNTSLAGVALNKGVTTITWTAKDAAGNTETQVFTVTVADDDKPTFTSTLSGNVDKGTNDACTYKVAGTEFDATATDNCAVTSLTYSLSGQTVVADAAGNTSLAGVALNKGVTTITWTAKDAAGNTETQVFTVTVADDDKPTFTSTLSGNVDKGTNDACTYKVAGTEFDATATDNCAVTSLTYSLSGQTVVADAAGNTSLAGVALNKGVTTITWTAKDAAGNTETQVFTVTVADDDKPTFTSTLSGNVDKGTNDACTYKVAGTEFDATATDNCAVTSLTYSLSGQTVVADAAGNTSLAGVALNKGVTTITWTAKDAAGNTETQVFTVTVADDDKPTFTSTLSGNVDKGTNDACTYKVAGTEFDATATDNCAVTSLTYSLSGQTVVADAAGNTSLAGVALNKGVTTITWTAKDAAGNTETQVFTVTVADDDKPTFTSTLSGNVDKGTNDACTYKVAGTEFDATATDNCAVTSLTYSLSGQTVVADAAGNTSLAGVALNKGVTTITWTAKDAAGNTETQVFTVTVADDDKPTFTSTLSGNVDKGTNDACTYKVAGTEFDATATDNCAVTSLTYSLSGQTVVADAAGNTSLAGVALNKGVTTITWTAKDAAGNTETQVFTVTVADDDKPTFTSTLSGNVDKGTNDACTYKVAGTEFDATATDNCAVTSLTYSLSGQTVVADAAGNTSLAGVALNKGVTTITWTAKDAAGNTETQVFTVTVADDDKPTFTSTLSGNVDKGTNDACTYKVAGTEFDATATDNCAVTSLTYSLSGQTVVADAAGNTSLAGVALNKGVTTITWTAKDAAGNTETQVFTVTVADDDKPTFTSTLSGNVDKGTNDACTYKVAGTEFDATATDNCAVTSLTYSLSGQTVVADAAGNTSLAGVALNKGVTTITWTAKDAAGNTETQVFTVTVADDDKPTFTSTLSGNVDKGTNDACTYKVAGTEFDATATDNCAVTSLTYSLSGQTVVADAAGNTSLAGVALNKGVTTITWTAKDAAGNTETQVFTVTVADDDKPTFTSTLSGNVDKGTNDACTYKVAGTEFDATATDNCAVTSLTYSLSGQTVVADAAGNTSLAGVALNKGVTTITWTAKDAAGNTETQVFTVTVADDDKPTFTSTLSGNVDKGTNDACTYKVAGTEFDATATDNCAVTSLTYSLSGQTVVADAAGNTSLAGVALNKGVTTITWTAKDAAGNTETQVFTVTVADDDKPTFTSTLSGNVDKGTNDACTYKVAGTEFDATATDNCAVTSLTYSLSGQTVVADAAGNTSLAGVALNKGVTTITWTAKDAAGNTETQVFTVTVADDDKPTFTSTLSGNVDKGTNDACTYKVAGTEFDATATDNCAVTSLTYSLSGQTVVADAAGNTSLAGVALNKGVTTITWTAKDAAGNTETQVFTVTVADDDKPTFTSTLSGNVDKGTNDACTYKVAGTEFDATATDNCAVTSLTYSLSGQTVVADAAGNTSLAGVALNKGVTTITWTAKDAAGNTETQVFTVTVADDDKPTFTSTLSGNVDKGTNDACTYKVAGTEFDATATDNCAVTSLTYSLSGQTVVADAAGNTSLAGVALNKGVTTITWTAKDAAGNTETQVFTVTVADDDKPTVNTQPVTIYLDATGQASVTAAQVNNNSTDNCSIPTTGYSLDKTSFTCANVGANTVTLTVTDANGNSASKTATVTVVDNTAPTVGTILVDQPFLWPPNHKMRNILLTVPTSDNCSSTWKINSVNSNEPVNGTGDGNSGPDWIIGSDGHSLQLRAEREGNGTGRDYTINVVISDPAGNSINRDVHVYVAHNINAPVNGNAVKVGTTVNFDGTFWDVAGKKHTAKWLVDGSAVATGVVTEPSGTKNGRVTGSYKFTTPGIYRLQMNVTDQNGVTSYVSTNGDLDAMVVVYDPNGGYTFGGGSCKTPSTAITSSANKTGKISYGFQSNYYKNATNPKGETQFDFDAGDFQFNALNFDYLVVNKSFAQFKGSGKISNENGVIQSGISFIMTVIDGQYNNATGDDKMRMKIFNKNTGYVYYDNMPGAADDAIPTTIVDAGSCITVISADMVATSNSTLTRQAASIPVYEQGVFDLKAYPNPSANKFTVSVQSSNREEKIQVRVMDLNGRVVELFNNLSANQTLQIGSNYRPGMYIVEMIQGNERKQLKLIKQPN